MGEKTNSTDRSRPRLPSWVVISVTPQDNCKLFITFVTGEEKIYDCRPLLDGNMFKRLKEPGIFKLAHVEDGTVVWNDQLDIAPEELYEKGIAV